MHNNSVKLDAKTEKISQEKLFDSASKPLFRQQAIAHASVRQYGTVILTRPFSQSVLTGIFVTLIILLIVFFIFFETTRKAPVQGMLVPTAGVIRIFSNQVGSIRDIRVKEGQFVKSGEILFVVTSERNNSNLHSTETIISQLIKQRKDSLQSDLQHLRIQSKHRKIVLQQRIKDLKDEVEQLNNQVLMQQKRIEISEENVARFLKLRETNYISQAQLQEREGELLEQRQRLLEIERMRSATQRDLATGLADAQEIEVQLLRDENVLGRTASMLEQDLTENEARREFFIRAPQSGTITVVGPNLGQTVSTGISLASILPLGSDLEAEIYVPSRAVGFIKPGMTAMLRYQAFPYQKFGQHRASVREVATTSVRPDELPTSAAAMPGAAQSEPVYRIRLALDTQTVKAYGMAMPLRSGMLIDGNIVLERRKLYEWILEPLFSISGRL